MAHVNDRFALKSPDSGQHFVKQDAGRENIRAMVGALAFRLFGRGVSRRAVRNSDFRNLGSIRRFTAVFVFVVNQFRQTEIENFRLPAVRHHYVSRFDVAVNDAARVRIGERVANLYANSQRAFYFERATGDELADVFALDILHRDVIDAVLFVEIENRADIRMVKLRAKLGFALKAFKICGAGS